MERVHWGMQWIEYTGECSGGKVLINLIRLNVLNVVKKCQKKNKKKNPFWGTSKNWRLDPKVCADPS